MKDINFFAKSCVHVTTRHVMAISMTLLLAFTLFLAASCDDGDVYNYYYSSKDARTDLLGNKVINGVTFEKTGEVVVVPSGKSVIVMGNNAYSEVYLRNFEQTETIDGVEGDLGKTNDYKKTIVDSTFDNYRGTFIDDTISVVDAFAIGKYEVTQELFEKVMGTNPSICTEEHGYRLASGETQKYRPVDRVNFYQAAAFCNKLSIIEGLDPCYSVDGITDWAALKFEDIPYYYEGGYAPGSEPENWQNLYCDFSKNGYRIPQSEEWELAARGGQPTFTRWTYPFSGIAAANGRISIQYATLNTAPDDNLNKVGWYTWNARDGVVNGFITYDGTGSAGTFEKWNDNKDKYTASTSEYDTWDWTKGVSTPVGYGNHEVGMKQANALGIYDMSGNVWEWTWTPANNESSSIEQYLFRGGGWQHTTYHCLVSSLRANVRLVCDNDSLLNVPGAQGVAGRRFDGACGFRLARTL